MQRLFRLAFGLQQRAQAIPTSEDTAEQLAAVRARIVHTVRTTSPEVDECTNLSRYPVWLRAEWAAALSVTLNRTITAADIATHRTARGLALWIHGTTLSEADITTLRQQGL